MLHARVSIRGGSILGARVVVQDGAVIGSDGFGFVTDAAGAHHKIPQLSRVVIEDDVEIGANTTIDRPAVGETRIGRGTKIDNLVMIAHGVQVGTDTLLAAQVGHRRQQPNRRRAWCWRARSASPGISPSATECAPRRRPASPTTSMPARFVSGYPAIDNRDWLKASAVFRRLPELRRRLAESGGPTRRARAGTEPVAFVP